jgi:hypothetical protein
VRVIGEGRVKMALWSKVDLVVGAEGVFLGVLVWASKMEVMVYNINVNICEAGEF